MIAPFRLAIALGLGFASATAGAGSAPRGIPHERYHLSNGLEVILHADDGVPVVRVDLTYRTGARDDPPGREGLAHLVEHLAFRGTKHLSANDIVSILRGGDADAHGATTLDLTKYTETLPASQLAAALWLESSRMGFLLDRPQDELVPTLDSERQIVLQELRLKKDETLRSSIRPTMVAALFPAGHPYQSNTIGTRESLSRITLDDVRSFYRRNYAANNAVLLISGNFDAPATKRLVETYFGGLPGGPPRRTHPPPLAPLPGEQRISIEAPRSTRYLWVAWRSAPAASPENLQADLLLEVLTAGIRPRLGRLLSAGLARDVTGSQVGLDLAGYLFLKVEFVSTATADDVAAALKMLDGEIARLRRSVVARPELNAASSRLRTRLAEGLLSVSGRSVRMRDAALSSTTPHQQLDVYQRTDGRALQRLARRIFTRGRVVVHVSRNDEAPLAGKVVAHEGPPPVASLDQPTPSLPAAIVNDEPFRHQRPANGVQRRVNQTRRKHFVLDNGLRVILLESHVAPVVNLRLVARAGNVFNPDCGDECAQVTSSFLNTGRTSPHREQLKRAFAAFGASSFGTAEEEFATSGLTVLTEHLENIAPLWAETLTRPRFDELGFARFRDDAVAQVRANITESDFAADVFKRSRLYGGWGMGHSLGYAGLATLSVTAVRSFFERHYRPQDAVLIVEGDLTPEEARVRLGRLLGSWKGNDEVVPIPVAPSLLEPKVILIDLPRSPGARIAMILPIPGSRHPDRVAVDTLGELFAGYRRRLFRRLREEKGWTYAINTEVRSLAAFASWSIDLNVPADKLADALRLIRSEMKALSHSRLTQAELDDLRETFIVAAPEKFAAPAEIVASALNENGSAGPATGGIEGYVRQLSALTVEGLTDVARKHFTEARATTLVLGDGEVLEPALRSLGAVEVWQPDEKRLGFVKRSRAPR